MIWEIIDSISDPYGIYCVYQNRYIRAPLSYLQLVEPANCLLLSDQAMIPVPLIAVEVEVNRSEYAAKAAKTERNSSKVVSSWKLFLFLLVFQMALSGRSNNY